MWEAMCAMQPERDLHAAAVINGMADRDLTLD